MAANWLDLIGAGISGGLFVKLIDYLYLEYIRRSKESKSAKALVDRHLDPILKSADELVGKLRSLAQDDFRQLQRNASIKINGHSVAMTNLLFLFGQFWSRIQILRMESLYINLENIEKGKQLKSFINTLELSRVRTVDRALQRGVGEGLIQEKMGQLKTMTYYEFFNTYQESEKIRFWFQPLVIHFERIKHTQDRQRLLVYGAIIHALINTLDPGHLTTRERPGWANKLTKKSRRELEYRIFPIYLPFVKNHDQYYQKNKKKVDAM